MSDRYKVTIEEDNGNGWVIEVIAIAVIIAVSIFAFVYVGIPALIIYGIYRLVKWHKKQKVLLLTKCTQCNKKNALVYWKTEIIKETPVQKTIYSKDKRGDTECITIMEYTHRKYDKCKFCGAINFTDSIANNK